MPPDAFARRYQRRNCMTHDTGNVSDGLEEVTALIDQHIGKIRDLNDRLRKHHQGGTVVVTPGITALGAAQFMGIMRAVSDFDSFTEDNDPHGEHDCAVMRIDGIKIIWKIDYYDTTRQFLSPDPTDPLVTRRVMTVMRADEY
jgi:hypothetical protein